MFIEEEDGAQKLWARLDCMDSGKIINGSYLVFWDMLGNYYIYAPPQRPCSFWSEPRIATSGQVQFFGPAQRISFILSDNEICQTNSEHAQSDRKSVNHRLPVLDLSRGRNSWCSPKKCSFRGRECATCILRPNVANACAKLEMVITNFSSYFVCS